MKKTGLLIALAIIIISSALKVKDTNSSSLKLAGHSNSLHGGNPNDEKTALIIVDLQNDYFKSGAMELNGAEEAAEKAKSILNHFRDKKMLVIHVKHIALQRGATFFLPGTKGADIYKTVLPAGNEKVINKNYPNSFRDTDLLTFLKKNKVKNLVFCGMMTDVCVDATVRAAMDYGYKNTVISDAVATRDRELNGGLVKSTEINRGYLAGLNALGGLYATVLPANAFLMKK